MQYALSSQWILDFDSHPEHPFPHITLQDGASLPVSPFVMQSQVYGRSYGRTRKTPNV
jgi:hypothetical protein